MSVELKAEQLAAVKASDLNVSEDRANQLLSIDKLNELPLNDLILLLKITNSTYRAGVPVVSDSIYDSVYLDALRLRDPEHEYLSTVEPEPIAGSKTVLLPAKMLSTNKAYTVDEINRWITRLTKAASEMDLEDSELIIRVTPKLDGYAAYDDGQKLYTRGDGVKGQDVSRAFVRGLQVAGAGQRGQGAGEIVTKKSYFEEHLSSDFENSRNIQASIIAEKNIDARIQTALDDGACVFFPFASLPNWEEHYSGLMASFESVVENIRSIVDFDIDGVILEVTHSPLKEYMGSTRHHHRWQIAYKANEESAKVIVKGVTPQTSRTGRLTPVAELVPTKLSGATISRATVHHYGMVKSKGVGKGAVVELVRSGLVIPKIQKVLERVDPELPKLCPSCDSHVVWDGDNIFCPNTTGCPAQTENTLVHFFKTLGNVDGFGPKVIAKLHESGIRSIYEIYCLTLSDFSGFGFGDKTSENLENELKASRSIEIEDWRFLAAFGITRMGPGNCERLLEHHSIGQALDVSVEDMISIDGFARLSAEAIHEAFKSIKEEFFKVYNLTFNLKPTVKLANKTGSDSPIQGKQVVFTGSMEFGSRGDMEKVAKAMGAKVGKSVTSKTTYLVTGAKVGERKIKDAEAKGVEVLTESDYIRLIDPEVASD